MAPMPFISELNSQDLTEIRQKCWKAVNCLMWLKFSRQWVSVRGATVLFMRKWLMSMNCHKLFVTVLFDCWIHFHKHTNPPNKMIIITNLTKADKVKQSNNVSQSNIMIASATVLFFQLKPFVRHFSISSKKKIKNQKSKDFYPLLSRNTFCSCSTGVWGEQTGIQEGHQRLR